MLESAAKGPVSAPGADGMEAGWTVDGRPAAPRKRYINMRLRSVLLSPRVPGPPPKNPLVPRKQMPELGSVEGKASKGQVSNIFTLWSLWEVSSFIQAHQGLAAPDQGADKRIPTCRRFVDSSSEGDTPVCFHGISL
ncbi:hypothetical protein C0Q70_00428 [Pomacea canaliculata]|uniref:Uncharacterized protein n=1 Tax=Pomacea canaliculata TaxID=400727 RepID=A0A2T7PWL5_POMCA|nr:hypothetical protein C0Q70_00428 [Pomacea canaliculata]